MREPKRKTNVRCSLFPQIAIIFRNAPNIKCYRLPLTGWILKKRTRKIVVAQKYANILKNKRCRIYSPPNSRSTAPAAAMLPGPYPESLTRNKCHRMEALYGVVPYKSSKAAFMLIPINRPFKAAAISHAWTMVSNRKRGARVGRWGCGRGGGEVGAPHLPPPAHHLPPPPPFPPPLLVHLLRPSLPPNPHSSPRHQILFRALGA